MAQSKRITIVGGKGQMGQLFAKLLQDISHHVQALDQDDWPRAKSLLANADLVLIAVPIHQTVKIIEKLKPYLHPDLILADLTSIQVKPLEAMLEVHVGPVLGLHPMFGPSISSTYNQGIIYSSSRQPEKYQWLLKDLKQLGFTLQEMSAAKHDSIMNFVQGLEHFNTIALGMFLRQHQVDIEELNKLASPIYRMKLLLLGRIFDQDPGLYADIIMADPSRLDLIEDYLNKAKGLLNELQSNNRKKVIEECTQVSHWLGEFTQLAQDETDKLLDRYYLSSQTDS